MYSVFDYWNNEELVAYFAKEKDALEYARSHEGMIVTNPEGCYIEMSVMLPF